MTKNMTEGKPLRLILQFALPLLLGNLLQQAYNIADAMIVGRALGPSALASVGSTTSVQFLVIGFCTGICVGFGIPVAKCFGANDLVSMRKSMFNAICLSILCAGVLTVACSLLCPGILQLLSVPGDVFDGAYAYLLVLFLGIPFTVFYNLMASFLRAVGDSRTPFLVLVLTTGINIVLDLLLILVLQLGCAGAALATILSQALSGLFCLLFILRNMPVLHIAPEERKLDRILLKNLSVIGIPMGLQCSITAIGSMVMQSSNNGLGSVYVSGFTAGMKLKMFALAPFDALGTAASVFSSQNLGAGKPQRIKAGVIQSTVVSTLYGVGIGLVLIVFGRPLSTLFMDGGGAADAVLDASAQYLRCMGYFMWTLGALSVCRTCTQGLGFSGLAIFSGVTEMVARSTMSLCFVGTYGFTAVCFTDQVAWVSACLYIIPVCIHCIRKVTREFYATAAAKE